MTIQAKLTLYAALATALASLGLSGLVDPPGWLMHAAIMVGVVAGTGALARRAGVYRAWVAPIQLLVALYLLMLGFAQSSLAFGLLPGARVFETLASLLSSGGGDIMEYAVPAPGTAGIRLILVGSVTLVAIMVDTVAVTYRRAAVAGLPLLAVYSVGTGLTGDQGVGWLWFLLGAFGYLALLFAEGQDRIARWGRVFHGRAPSGPTSLPRGGPTSLPRGGPTSLPRSGHRVGLIALAAALVLPALVQPGRLGLIHGGPGSGSGGDDGLTSLDPVVALTAGLNRPSSVEMLRYTADSGSASQYLRIGALDDFDGVAWRFSQQHPEPLPEPMPGPAELSPAVPVTPVTTQVTISNRLSTPWLPMPYPATTVDVPGSWQYEADTRTVLGGSGRQITGLRYQVTSLDVEPTADELRQTGPPSADIARRYLALPANLPTVVRQTAEQVTAGRQSAYDKALALQNWFATSGEFRYSLMVDAGTGSDAIVKFLHDRTGFCVHFAATMAAMARTLGIPARVAIGFAPGEDQGDDTYLVRSSDYHSWPELYFEGVGWLRFEPTPAQGTITMPDYAHDQAGPGTASPTEQPSAVPSAVAGALPSAATGPSASASSGCGGHDAGRPRAADCTGGPRFAAPVSHPAPWWRSGAALAAYAGVLVLLGLPALPMLLRIRLRRTRLGTGRRRPGAEPLGLTEQHVLAAWWELVDTAWDLGIPPDEAHAPRRAARRIAEAGQLDPAATAAAGRIALATEQVLYARRPQVPPPLWTDVRAARNGLRATAGRRRRLRADLLPASTARVWWAVAERAADCGARANRAWDGLRLRLARR